MKRMSFAETAIFFQLDSIGCGFFVFAGHIITPFAFGAGHGNSYSHCRHLLTDNFPLLKEALN
jgi:hypothetical protein